ncbi:hypothetical protein [Halorhabdus salina]|uniref:hypothetical protein n=1 Tax=Halorhabdus salina TaxID=2750670 RepID=UPI0015EED4FD|nr:hypothetical protein [Halorhabdus salina]
MTDKQTRRKYLTAVSGLFATGLAGCSGGNETTSSDETVGGSTTTDEKVQSADLIENVEIESQIEDHYGNLNVIVGLVNDHSINKINLIGPEGQVHASSSVPTGATKVTMKILDDRGADVEEGEIPSPGAYEIALIKDGSVVQEQSLDFTYDITVENISLVEDGYVTQFRLSVRNEGEIPIQPETAFVTGDVPDPGSPDGRNAIIRGVGHDAEGHTAGIYLWPGYTSPIGIGGPLSSVVSDDCNGDVRNATIHLHSPSDPLFEIDVEFVLSGDARAQITGKNVCSSGEVQSWNVRRVKDNTAE